MAALFADLPEALDNTVEIARRCAFRPLQRAADPAALPDRRRSVERAARPRRRSSGARPRRARRSGSRSMASAPGYDAAAYAERLDFELDVITGMNFPGYFLIVADFIKWAKAQGIPVGPGPRLGRRLARRLGAHHHRSRPLALRPAVRALPQSRARVDAGLRHRFLPGPARRGDRLCAASDTAHDRVAQIITFGKLQARAVLRDVGRVLQMPYGQVDRLCKLVPMNPANPVTLPQAIAGEPRLQEARDAEPIVRQAARDRPAARRPLPPRLDPCRRRRHRRPAADRAGAALSRPALAAAGHPVQHEMGRKPPGW